MLAFLLPLVLVLNVFGAEAPRPNPKVTTGIVCTTEDPDFDRHRYPERIAYCRRNVHSWTKDAIYLLYGIPERCHRYYTIDHFIPLSIGGSNDPRNLWPEHKKVKATRRGLEMDLYRALSAGEITQADAIRIVTDAKTQAIEVQVPECQ